MTEGDRMTTHPRLHIENEAGTIKIFSAIKGRLIKAPEIDAVLEVEDEEELRGLAEYGGPVFRLRDGWLFLLDGRWLYVMFKGGGNDGGRDRRPAGAP